MITASALTSALVALVSLGAVSGGLFGLLHLIQPSLILHPDVTPPDFVYTTRNRHVEVWLESSAGKLHALALHPMSHASVHESRGLLLHFHGNAGDLKSWSQVADELVDQTSWSVLMVDYPGFGKSAGQIQGDAEVIATAQAVVAWAAKQKDLPIVIYGRSFGTGAAAAAAVAAAELAPSSLAGVVLESPFFSLRSLIHEKAPWAPSWIIRFTLPVADWLQAARATGVSPRLLLLHGALDTLIPSAHSIRIQSSLDPKANWSHLAIIPNASHNDLAFTELYWSELVPFLRSLEKKR
jgi:hypothetical protein